MAKMTNKDKFLKEGVSVEEFVTFIANSLIGECWDSYETTKADMKNELIEIMNEQAKPTLTEDERAILRNIQLYTEKTVAIRRAGDGHLYINGGCGLIDFGEYNHLFQFIKERRRI